MTFEEWWTKKWRGASRLAIAREAWVESRENMQEYGKHAFCKDMKCPDLLSDGCMWNDDFKFHCQYTAREFHHWLQENGYRIVKK